jgi:hypothetical protein
MFPHLIHSSLFIHDYPFHPNRHGKSIISSSAYLRYSYLPSMQAWGATYRGRTASKEEALPKARSCYPDHPGYISMA